MQRHPVLVANVMGCYSTQRELARHDSRAHVQQLTVTHRYLSFFNWRDITVIILINGFKTMAFVLFKETTFSVALCIMRMRA